MMILLVISLVCFIIAALTDWREDWFWPVIRFGWLGLAFLMGFFMYGSHRHQPDIFIILAFVCFMIATFTSAYWPRVRIGWIGLALFVASMLVRP